MYRHHHLAALQKAARAGRETLPTETRRALLLAALADEAFALHFLQDTDAAGHIAGTWGDASQRKGTHDDDNEHGLEVSTWSLDGSPVVVVGDAHMHIAGRPTCLSGSCIHRDSVCVVPPIRPRAGF